MVTPNLTRARILITLTTLFVVFSVATAIFLYAKGYRFKPDTLEVTPSGILVMKSVPDGAQIFINGELETATNATVSLTPGKYDIEIKKEGYITWSKRLDVFESQVTEATAHLFKTAPSLSALTFSGTERIVPSEDFSKLSYVIPTSPEDTADSQESGGLWVIEMINLPIGFARDPKQITDGNLEGASWIWSPDGREILLTTKSGDFLLDATTFTPQKERVNITARKDEILEGWEEEKTKRLDAQVKKLPDELITIIKTSATDIVFSPDEDMLMYKATHTAIIPDELIKPFPGSSTQKQERTIQPGKVYVYDIKEDRNFLVDDDAESVTLLGGSDTGNLRRITWFPTARHLVVAEPNTVTIMDYDGTNRQRVFTGLYTAPHAFPALSLDRLIILTNFGSEDTPANLYSLGLK